MRGRVRPSCLRRATRAVLETRPLRAMPRPAEPYAPLAQRAGTQGGRKRIMTVTLELSLDDARLLRDPLLRHIAEVDDELVHTERRQLRHEIALDVDHLRQIETRLARLPLAGGSLSER